MAATDTAGGDAAGKEGNGAGLEAAELARDTATIGDKTSGLARVLVELASGALADDIADLALDALRAATPAANGRRAYAVRVADDPAHLRDVDAHRLLRAQLDGLRARLDAYAPPPGAPDGGDESLIAAAGAALAGLSAVATAVGALAGPVASLFSKLSARDLQLAGREVDPSGLGFDLAVARALERKSFDDEDITVRVERLRPTPDSAILAATVQLALDAQAALRPAAEDEEADAGTALLAAIEALVTAAVTPDARGVAPVVRAARVEDLVAPAAGAPPTHVLFARLTAGGIDQVLATKVGSDRWTATAGASAEFALVAGDGTVLQSGTRSALQATTMKPGDPRSVRQFRPAYAAIERERRR